MRTEINLKTGEITEHEDDPAPLEDTVQVTVAPTKEQLLAQLQALQAQIESLV